MMYTIKHSCGCTESVQLYGKTSERERRIAYLASIPCAHCRASISDLTGTDKQIAWAESIRREYRKAHQHADVLTSISAAWWIDHRNELDKLASQVALATMTRSDIMRRAHQVTRAMAAKYGKSINYAAQLSVNLKTLYAGIKAAKALIA